MKARNSLRCPNQLTSTEREGKKNKQIVTSLSQCAPSNRTPDIFYCAARHASTISGLQNEGGCAAGRMINLCVYELLRPAPSFVREYRPDSDEQRERRTQSRPLIERRESQLAGRCPREIGKAYRECETAFTRNQASMTPPQRSPSPVFQRSDIDEM